MLDRRTRRFATLLDALPGKLHRADRWMQPSAPARNGHQHHVPTLAVCLAGTVHISGAEGVRCLTAGEALIIAPGVWHHHLVVRQGSAWFGQGFIGSWSDLVLADAEGERYGQIPGQPSRRLLAAALAASDAGRLAAVRDVLRYVLDESDQPAVPTSSAAWRMMHLLWKRAHLGADASDLVRASGLARTRACAEFRKAFGLSPYQALLQARLGLAEGLLAAGLPVGDVAPRCGFASRRSFNRAWLRRHGKAPRRTTAGVSQRP